MNHSEARAALQLKFVIRIEFDTTSNVTDRAEAQFIWRYNPQWVVSEFVNDCDRVATHSFVLCRTDREPTSSKGTGQSVDLSNVRTLMAAHGRDRGSLVGVYRAANDLARRWRENVRQARERGLLGEVSAQCLSAQFDMFVQSYTAAVKGCIENGLASPELERQLDTYGQLLESLCLNAKGDRTRQLLLRPLLQVGTVAVQGGRPTAIVAPWHPLRMAAMARKARRAAGLVRDLLMSPQVQFGDPRLLAKVEGTPSLIYAQVPFATPEEIAELVQLIRSGPE